MAICTVQFGKTPPNSGKTYTLIALAELCIEIGQIKSINAGSQFPFQSVDGKKCIFMDEPVIPKKFEEEFKELLAGQSIYANMKHKDAVYTAPVPFIMCSNNDDMVDFKLPYNIHIKSVRCRRIPVRTSALAGTENCFHWRGYTFLNTTYVSIFNCFFLNKSL